MVGTWKDAEFAAEHRPWSHLADLFQKVWRQNSYVDFHALRRNQLRLRRRFSREGHSFTSLRLLKVHVTPFSKPWGLWPDTDFCPISRKKERVRMMKHWDF